MARIKTTKLEQLLLAISMMMWSAFSWADGAPAIGTSDDLAKAAMTSGDQSAIAMATKLFGSIMTDPMSMNADGSMLGTLFGVINASLMVIGTVWVSYSIISGTVMTAHQGEFLGKNMSSVWIPIRLVSGIGSMVPIKGGYCLAQFVMMAAIQLGIGMGNLTWQASVERTQDGNALTNSHAINGRDLTVQLLLSNVCLVGLNSGISTMTAAQSAAAVAGYKLYAMNSKELPDGRKYYSFGKQGTNITGKECGSYETPIVVNHKSNGMSNQAGKSGSLFVGTNDALFDTAEAAATAAYVKGFEALNSTIFSLVNQYGKEFALWQANPNSAMPPVFNIALIDAVASAYNANIESEILAIQRTLNSSSKSGNFMAALKEDQVRNGFINAGAWYMTIGTANSIAQDAMSKSVKMVSRPQTPDKIVGLEPYYAKLVDAVGNSMNKSQNNDIAAASSDNGGEEEAFFWKKLRELTCDSKASNLSNSSAGGTSSSLGQCIIGAAIADSSAAPAITRISSIGNTITAFGSAIITAKGALQGLSDQNGWTGELVKSVVALGSGGTSGAALGILSEWLKIAFVIAETMFFWGIIASVWIPMIPAVIWIGGVASLLAVWVEAVVAAPLWAFAHLDTDGEGMGQRAQTGYLFIMNVLFRPSLMVVGFVLGSQMVDILTEYVVALFPSIIANANVDSWTGLIKICAYISAFVIILQTIVSISFSMIRFVPDQVLGWLGGNANNNIGQQAEDVAGGATKNAFAMRGSMSGPGVMDKAKQANQANQDRIERKATSDAQNLKDEKNEKDQASRHGEIMAQNNAMMDRLGGLGNGGNMGGVAGAGKGQRN